MTHHSTLHRSRGGLDDLPFELDEISELQAKLDAANLTVPLTEYPTIAACGQALENEVRARVSEIVRQSVNYGMDDLLVPYQLADLPVGEQTDAIYGQYDLDGSNNTVAGEMKAAGFDGGIL